MSWRQPGNGDAEPGRDFCGHAQIGAGDAYGDQVEPFSSAVGEKQLSSAGAGPHPEKDRHASGSQSITVEDSMSMVYASLGTLQPASPYLRSEPAIVAGLARATLLDSKVPWEALVADCARIRDASHSTGISSVQGLQYPHSPAVSSFTMPPRNVNEMPLMDAPNLLLCRASMKIPVARRIMN